MPNATAARLTGPHVVALAYDGLCTFEFGIVAEVFGLPRPEFGPGWYRFSVCGIEPGPLRAAGGLTFSVDRSLDLLAEADLIIAPGWRGIDTPVPLPLVAALREAAARGARVMSLCSGAAVLAAAGLLAGRRATTHWRYVAALTAAYPDVTFDADVLYVDAGAVLTAAGSAAGIDLCLHVVRNDFGPRAANGVARRLVVQPHREGGQAQFIEAPIPPERDAARLAPLLDWMRSHLDETLPIAILARRAGMSARTFQRRFEAATGLAPGAWLVTERLRRARELLEERQDAPLDDIATAAGFATLATMRHHFRARLAVSPGRYRERFTGRRTGGQP